MLCGESKSKSATVNKLFKICQTLLYNRGMIWVRKTLAYLLSLILLLALVAGVFAGGVTTAFAHPDKVKAWLSQSKVYDHFVSEVIQQSQKSIGSSDQSNSVSLSDATVQQAAADAFSPALLQDSVNKFLDGNYAWLQGKTAKPEFIIDLTQAKQGFASQVGQYVQVRFSKLPICAPAQLAQLQNVDPLAAPCRPANLTAEAEGSLVTQQLAHSGDFLSNPVITADTLSPKGKEQSQPYYQKLSFAPKAYRWATKTPLILGALALLTALAVFFLLPRRKGLRRIAVVLVEAGIILVAAKFVADQVLKRIETKVFNTSNVGQLQQSLTDFAHRVETALTKFDLWFGIAFLVVAALIIMFLLVTGQRQPKVPPIGPATNPEPAEPAATDASTPQASPQSPNSRRSKLIQ